MSKASLGQAEVATPERGRLTGVLHILATREDALGFTPIRPGEAEWFRADRWKSNSLASVSGVQVRLIWISATDSGTGAFDELCLEARRRGMFVTVIEPLEVWRGMLERRNWKRRLFELESDDMEERWTWSLGADQ